MLVRDGDSGMEVFMLRRNLNSHFVAGAYVFPGGAVDDADHGPDLPSVCHGRTDEEASRLMGLDQGGLAYWAAAVRECFEEAGVLLAFPRVSAQQVAVSFADPAVAERFRTYRAQVYAGTMGLSQLCHREQLVLDAGRIRYFGHWITPARQPRRFDTRFFVAAAPAEQVPLHDDGETIAHMWVRPGDALHRHAAGEIDLILPTIRSLKAISRFERSADLLDAAAAVEGPGGRPRTVSDSGGRRIALPGDPDGGRAARAKPVDGPPATTGAEGPGGNG